MLAPTRKSLWRLGVALVLVLGLGAGTAAAEKKQPKKAGDAALDLDSLDVLEGVEVEKLVIEALKSETTVQEAPAILTVLTGEQIRQQGYRFGADAVGAVPGFLSAGYFYQTTLVANPRGLLGGGLFMMDGLDLADVSQSLPTMAENVPVEMINRIELMSGPGGVLWGANSLVGVINVVTRTADDLEGVEASVGWGSGRGRPNDFRGYVIGGVKLWDDRIKFLIHASYETMYKPELPFPFGGSVARYTSPYPQGPVLMSGPRTSHTPRNHLVTLSGNAQLGPVSVHWHVPIQQNYLPVNWMGTPLVKDLGEDGIDCANPANAGICALRVDPDKEGRDFQGTYVAQYAFIRYRDRFLKDRVRLDGRVFWNHSRTWMEHYVSLIPSSVFPGGVVIANDLKGDIFGGSLDADISLPWKLRLLAGGEVSYDYYPIHRTNFFTDRSVVEARLPYVCPPDQDGKVCPVIINYASNRVTGGGFLDLQRRILPTLSLEAGARVQASGGKRPLPAKFLFSGGAVWSFLPSWNLKLNYSEGFRPPPLHRTDANGEGVNFTGNPDLEVESSRSIQGEVNAVLLRGHKGLRQLAFRTNYSYTWIDNFIQLQNGTYRNVAELGINSVEFLAELSFKKGHWLALGYTFLDMADSDRGKVRNVPNQWIVARAFFNLYNRQLFLRTNLEIRASAQDVNKYPATPAGQAYLGDVDENGVPKQEPTWSARAVDVVVDRLPPMALWNAGLAWAFKDPQIELAADFYNILDGQFYEGDSTFDPAAYLEFSPVPLEGFSFFLSAKYTY